MPELPDVEVFRRRFANAGLRQRIESIDVRKPRILGNVSPPAFAAQLRGHAFTSAVRHGKHLYARLDDGGWLDMHFGMTGALRYFRDADPEPEYDRLVIGFENGAHLGYYDRRLLGRINLVEGPNASIARKRLGPDALSLDYPTFKTALAGARGMIKAVLMDQTRLAGIGNIYSDEILFQARIHPQTRVEDLDEPQLKGLFRTMRAVLDKAIEREADPNRLPPDYLIRHRRRGAACPRCGGTVAQRKIGGRSSYYCPACQAGPQE